MDERAGGCGDRRIGALDGVRGLAVVAVLGFHAFPGAVPGGFFGVEAFFVLSGFLLGRLLLAEHRRTGSIDVSAFAGRRLRRIVPALWVLLVGLVLAAPFVAASDAHRLPGDVAWSAVGLTNWHLVLDQSSYFGQLGRPPLVLHLWSIAVEAQFYLVCPFLMLWVARLRRRVAIAALSAGVAGSALLMAVLAAGGDTSRAYYGTDSRAGALLSGALLALVLGQVTTARLARLRRFADPAAGAGTLVLVALCCLGRNDMTALYPLGFLAVQAATAAVIVGAVAGAASGAALGSLPLRWLGERSYGIYLWHWPIVALLRPGIDVQWDSVDTGLVGIVAAVALGHGSYLLVERPLMSRRRLAFRLPLGARPVAATSALLLVAGVAGIVVHLPDRDPIADTIRAGELVIASQVLTPPVPIEPPPSTSVAPLSATASRPSITTATTARATTTSIAAPVRATAPAPTPTPTPTTPVTRPPPTSLAPGPPPGSVSVTAVGDSVMLSAAGQLKARLGPSGSIDAKVSRQFREGVAVVATLRQQGRLAPVVVVHLGTNGPPTAADVDAMMSAAGTSLVLLLTVRVNRDWNDETNGVLAAGPSRHPNATLVDWHSLSAGHGDWFHSDGTHLTARGADAYTALIGSMLPPTTTPPPTSTPPAAAPTTVARP